MTKIKLTDFTTGKTTVRGYCSTLKTYILANFAMWGWYDIKKDGKTYFITDKFTGELLYTVQQA